MESLGVSKIGFCMTIFGGTSVVGAIIMGKLSDSIGRMPCLITAAVSEGAALVFLMQWTTYVQGGRAKRVRRVPPDEHEWSEGAGRVGVCVRACVCVCVVLMGRGDLEKGMLGPGRRHRCRRRRCCCRRQPPSLDTRRPHHPHAAQFRSDIRRNSNTGYQN